MIRTLGVPISRRLRPGMETNAYILMVSSILTGVLGVVYWVAAERLFPTDEVGRAAATISTATMLSSLACLSLGGSYQRFLPLAGARSRTFIVAGIALTAAVAVVLGVGFNAIGGGGDAMFDSTLERWLFPLMIAVLTAYALLDPILIGLRRAGTVAAMNVSHAALKLAVLPLLAFSATGSVVVGSWVVLALAVSVWVIAVLLRTGLADRAGVEAQLPPVRQIWAFQGASLTMGLVQTVTPLCMPLIVLARLGPQYSAYYNIVASLGVAVSLLRANVGASFVVEASAPGADRAHLTRRMLKLMAAVCVTCSAGLALGGPVLLWITGQDYADAATALVLVMAVETLVGGITAAYSAVAYVSRRLRVLLVAQTVLVVTTLAGALVLVPESKLLGVGLAALGAQLLTVAIIAVPFARQLRELGVLR